MAESKDKKRANLNAALRSFLAGAVNLVLIFSFSNEIGKLLVIITSLVSFGFSVVNVYSYLK